MHGRAANTETYNAFNHGFIHINEQLKVQYGLMWSDKRFAKIVRFVGECFSLPQEEELTTSGKGIPTAL